jgi:hypothetical protein
MLLAFLTSSILLPASRAQAQSAPQTILSTNLAYGQRTSQSSGTTGFRAVDGSNSVAITNTENESWWQVDLGTQQTIESIEVQREGCCWEQPLVVFVSDQPFTTTSISATTTSSGVSRYDIPAYQTTTMLPVNRSGHYVRVQMNGLRELRLAEVRVLGQQSQPLPEVLTASAGATPGGVWHYRPTTGWVLKNNGLPSGVHWQHIVASPQDRNVWAIIGHAGTGYYGFDGNRLVMVGTTHSPVWRTVDAGASWQAVDLVVASDPPSTYLLSSASNMHIAFDTETPSRMHISATVVAAQQQGWYLSISSAILWRGASSTLQGTSFGGWQGNAGVDLITAGVNGDSVVSYFHYSVAGGCGIGWMPAANSAAYGTPSCPMVASTMDTIPNDPTAVVAQKRNWFWEPEGLWATPDYRTTTITARNAQAVGSSLSVAHDGVYIGGRGYWMGGGLIHVASPLGNAQGTIVIGEGLTTQTVRADRQTRTAVAARADSLFFARASNGHAWGTIPLPHPTQTSSALEVLPAELTPTDITNDAISVTLTDAQGQRVRRLSLNDNDWPLYNAANATAFANPVTVTVTITNTGLTNRVLSPVVKIGSQDPDTSSRFFPLEIPARCSGTGEGETYSYNFYEPFCTGVNLAPGMSFQYQWEVWVQPSSEYYLRFGAELSTTSTSEPVAANTQAMTYLGVPRANIRPMIVVPGFIGSWPREGGMVIDPIAGFYDGLLTNLEVLGYEKDVSIVPFPYRWYGGLKNPNDKNDVVDLGLELQQKIDTWWFNRSGRPYVDASRFDLVAHSTGGLITRQYVANTGAANKLHNVVLVAIPHQGSPMAYAAWEGQALVQEWGGDLLKTAPGYVIYMLLQAFAEKSGCYNINPGTTGGEKYVSPIQMYHYVQGLNCETTQFLLPGVPNVIASIPQPGIPLAADLMPSVQSQDNGRKYIWRTSTGTLEHGPSSPVLSNPTGIGSQVHLNNFVDHITDDGFLHTVFSNNVASLKHYTVTQKLDKAPLWVNGNSVPGDGSWRPDAPVSDDWKGLLFSNDRTQSEQYGGDGTVPAWSGNLRNAITSIAHQNRVQELQFPQPGVDLGGTNLELTHNDFFNTSLSMRRIAARFIAPSLEATQSSKDFAPTLPFVEPEHPWQTEFINQREFILTNLCPVTVLVTDPQGRRVGTLPDGTTVNEIPGAYYSGYLGDDEPGIIHFRNPLAGTYTYTLTGVDSGEYNIYSSVVDQQAIERLGYFTGNVQPGQVITYTGELMEANAPDQLLFIDDGNNPATRTYITDALTAIGRPFTVWSIAQQGLPSATTLFPYETVIWHTSDNTGLANEQAALLNWFVGRGGKLLISGQNITNGLHPNLVTETIHSQVVDSATTSRLVAGEDVLAGIQFTLNGSESANNQTTPDTFAASVGVRSLGKYADGNGVDQTAILGYESALGRKAVLGFGLEGIDTANHRKVVLERLFRWLEQGDTRLPFPTTAVLDTFDRVDGAVGTDWAGATNNYAIEQQQLRTTMSSGSADSFVWGANFGANQEVFTTLRAIDTTAGEINLILKDADRGDGWNMLEVMYQPALGTVEVWTVHNWGTWLKHGDTLNVNFAAGDTFGARALADGTVEVYKNGALVGSVQVSAAWPARPDGGRIGVWLIDSANTRLDDIGGGTLPLPVLPPTTPILDSFDRADGALGSNWSGAVSAFAIQSQTMHNIYGTGSTDAVLWNEPFGANQEVYATLTAIDAQASEINLVLKHADRGDGWNMLVAWYQPQRGTVQIWSVHSWGTWIQHGLDIPINLAAGDRFGAHARSDGTIEISKNGVVVGNATISTAWPHIGDGGQIGIWLIDAPTTVVDDFGGGTIQ